MQRRHRAGRDHFLFADSGEHTCSQSGRCPGASGHPQDLVLGLSQLCGVWEATWLERQMLTLGGSFSWTQASVPARQECVEAEQQPPTQRFVHLDASRHPAQTSGHLLRVTFPTILPEIKN